MTMPTKVGPVGKESTHNSKGRGFDSHCRCEGLVGRRSVSTSISVYSVLRPALTLVSPRGPTHLNFSPQKKILYVIQYFIYTTTWWCLIFFVGLLLRENLLFGPSIFTESMIWSPNCGKLQLSPSILQFRLRFGPWAVNRQLVWWCGH